MFVVPLRSVTGNDRAIVREENELLPMHSSSRPYVSYWPPPCLCFPILIKASSFVLLKGECCPCIISYHICRPSRSKKTCKTVCHIIQCRMALRCLHNRLMALSTCKGLLARNIFIPVSDTYIGAWVNLIGGLGTFTKIIQLTGSRNLDLPTFTVVP
jgi:hypothetical protein